MPAFFCEKTGQRIAAPGVCKAVDPINGQDDFSEQPIPEAVPSSSAVAEPPQPAPEPAPAAPPAPKQESKPADHKADHKPAKG